MITIAIPVYERDTYFYDALNSALSQTIPCKIIIVDNNSSHTKFKDAVEFKNLSNISYVKNDANLGMVGNWNKCIELCETEYLTILHDDDMLHHQFIEYFFNVKGDWDLLFTKSYVGKHIPQYFNKNRNIFNKNLRSFKVNDFILGNYNYAPGTIFKTLEAKKVGYFTNEYGAILDFHFWLKLVKQYKAVYSNIELSFYRDSSNQGTKVLYKDMVNNTYKLFNEVPIYRKNKFLALLTNFEIYSGGLFVYFLNPGNSSKDVKYYFADDASFIRDHKRFYFFYKYFILRKTCKIILKILKHSRLVFLKRL